MTRDETLRELVVACLDEIAPGAGAQELDPDADLRVALDLDSMDVFDLVAALAARTGVDIPDAEIPKLNSVDAFASRLATAAS